MLMYWKQLYFEIWIDVFFYIVIYWQRLSNLVLCWSKLTVTWTLYNSILDWGQIETEWAQFIDENIKSSMNPDEERNDNILDLK